MAHAQYPPSPFVPGTAGHLRRIKQLRDIAPADHFRYLSWLCILYMAKPCNAEDLIEMYREEFDL